MAPSFDSLALHYLLDFLSFLFVSDAPIGDLHPRYGLDYVVHLVLHDPMIEVVFY